jgi:hypothetical protein
MGIREIIEIIYILTHIFPDILFLDLKQTLPYFYFVIKLKRLINFS